MQVVLPQMLAYEQVVEVAAHTVYVHLVEHEEPKLALSLTITLIAQVKVKSEVLLVLLEAEQGLIKQELAQFIISK